VSAGIVAGSFFGDYVLSSAGAATRFADDSSSAKTFGALILDDSGSVANVTFHDAFLSLQFSSALAFITLSRYRACAFALRAANFAFTVTSTAWQK
jgi:hypothetical protein